jgi:formate dehydrogenase alpha subunit
LIVVQDILFNETSGIADVVMPAAAFSEKTGSFTNMEGHIQCFTPAVSPPGNAKPDLEILGMLAAKLGSPGHHSSYQEIRKEISNVITCYSDGAACKHPIWIREEGQAEEGQTDQQIAFSPMTWSTEIESDDQFPLIALFGSSRIHLGSGTRTDRSSRVSACEAMGEIEVSTADAERMSLADNDRIKVKSAAGEIERSIRISRGIEAGYIWIPTAFNSNDARNLISFEPLLEPGASGWDSCAVAVEKAETSSVDSRKE